MLAVDEAQRLPGPCLEYRQSLWDHPGTRITLCCAGRAVSVACISLNAAEDSPSGPANGYDTPIYNVHCG